MYLSGFFLKTPFYHSLKVSKQKLVKSDFLKVLGWVLDFIERDLGVGVPSFKKLKFEVTLMFD